jgi:hypothetical protein
MGKKKGKKVLDIIGNADIRVTVPEKTDEINPVKFPVPGFRTERTEAGVAKIGKNKALYLRLRLMGGD